MIYKSPVRRKTKLAKVSMSSLFLICILLLSIVPIGFAGNLYVHLSFDGIDDYVNCGNDSSLDLENAFSIEVWMKNPTDIQFRMVIGRIDTGGLYSQFWYLAVQHSVGHEPNIETALGDGANYSVVRSDWTDGLIGDEWIPVVWIRDGDTQKIYINGVDETQEEGSYIDPGIGDVNPPTDVIIGGDIQSDDYYFKGLIDEVHIYNRAINSTEITYSFINKEPQNQTGLVMWLRMNEGTGDAVYDETTNNNDGTLMPNYPSNAPTWIDVTPPPETWTVSAAEVLIYLIPLLGLCVVVGIATSPLKSNEKVYTIIGVLITIVVLVIFNSILAGL